MFAEKRELFFGFVFLHRAGAAACDRRGRDFKRNACCGASTQVQHGMCRMAQICGAHTGL